MGKVEGRFRERKAPWERTPIYGVEGILEFATAATEIGTKKRGGDDAIRDSRIVAEKSS